jgi:hypothetical protein
MRMAGMSGVLLERGGLPLQNWARLLVVHIRCPIPL